MGCGCTQKKRGCYENTKELAQKYAKSTGKDVVLYAKSDKTFAFMDAEAPERSEITVIELVPAML
jgi:hypothetical protein